MKEQGSHNMADVVAANRSLREAAIIAREKKISVRGIPGAIISARQSEVVRLSESMRTVHQDWVTKKFESLLPYLQRDNKKSPEDTVKRVTDHYNAGLATAVTLLSRTSKKDKSGNAHFDDQDAVVAYTTRFVNMLRVCERLAVSPQTALTLAKKSYKVDAPHLLKLVKDYNKLPQGIILRAAEKKPEDPERFLDDVLSTVDRLAVNPRYSNVASSILLRAAESYSANPEKFMDTFLITSDRLSANPRYKDLNPHDITVAASGYPSDPEKYLDSLLRRRKKKS